MRVPTGVNRPALVAIAVAAIGGVLAGVFSILLILLYGYQDFGFWVIPIIVIWMGAFVTMITVGVRVAKRVLGR